MTSIVRKELRLDNCLVYLTARVVPIEKFGPLEVQVYGERYLLPEGRIIHDEPHIKLENLDGSPYCHPNTYFNGTLDMDCLTLDNALHCRNIGVPVRTKQQLEKYRIISDHPT